MRFTGWCFLMAGFVAGCSTVSQELETAPELMTASGQVKVTGSDEQNQKVKIDVKHLARPERVQPGAKVFVLWAQPTEPKGSPVQNLGAFSVDEDLRAALEAKTPYSKFDVFVTAEPGREATSPTGKRLLWSRIDY
jgi:hypothetical protein